jgi:CRISPR-associated protein Cas2
MEILVTYDVATDTAAGRRRLRRVAKVCEAFGQRVQYSVFECIVNAAQLEQLKHQLEKEVKPEEDSLRIYRLQEPRERYLHVIGRVLAYDVHDPLVF